VLTTPPRRQSYAGPRQVQAPAPPTRPQLLRDSWCATVPRLLSRREGGAAAEVPSEREEVIQNL